VPIEENQIRGVSGDRIQSLFPISRFIYIIMMSLLAELQDAYLRATAALKALRP